MRIAVSKINKTVHDFLGRWDWAKRAFDRYFIIKKVLQQSLKEMKMLLRYNDKTFDDQDFCGYKIRMHSHVLEKHLKEHTYC